MSASQQYLEQLNQQAVNLLELADAIKKEAQHLIQENPKEEGMFVDQGIANDTFAAILFSTNLKEVANKMSEYCSGRLSDISND